MSTAEERLQELLKEMERYESKSGFFKPDLGPNLVRVLPGVGGMKLFFFPQAKHYNIGDEPIICAHITSGKTQDCPICAVYAKLKAAGADKDSLARFSMRTEFAMNVVKRNIQTDAHGGILAVTGSDGPYPFTPGRQTYDQMVGIVRNPAFGDFTDPEAPTDLIITKEKTGSHEWNVKYTVEPYLTRAPDGVSFVAPQQDEDAERMADWMSEALDHSEIRNRIPTWDEVIEKAAIQDFFVGD